MSEYRIVYGDELYHHGVKGQKWGVRREQRRTERRIAKITKYRDKLARRAKFKASWHESDVEDNKKALADLNKNGRNSEVYKKARDAHFEKKKSDYEWNHGSGTYGAWQALSDLNSFEMNSRTTMKELRKELKSNLDSSTKKAETWASRNKKLMNTPISELTTKEDIKKIYKGK